MPTTATGGLGILWTRAIQKVSEAEQLSFRHEVVDRLFLWVLGSRPATFGRTLPFAGPSSENSSGPEFSGFVIETPLVRLHRNSKSGQALECQLELLRHARYNMYILHMRPTTLALSTSVSTRLWTGLHAGNLSSSTCRVALQLQTTLRLCASAGQIRSSSSSSSHSDATYEYLLAQGRGHTAVDDLESAVQAFELAVDLQPRSAQARAELGRTLVRSGLRSVGFDNLVAAFELDSLCPGVKDGLREYYKSGLEESYEFLSRGLCWPGDVDLHEGLAALCIDSGLAEEAAAGYRRCLELSSSSLGDPSSIVVDKARIDRWSIALFKCHASVCHWDRWYAEARALQEAVRDQGGAVSSPPPSNPADEGVRDDPLWSEFDSLADWDGSPSREHVWETSSSTPAAEEGSTDSPGCTGGEQRHGREICSPSVVNVAGDVTMPCDVMGDNDVVLRPPLHPFDSLSAPLSIGDCLALAQRQSQCILAEGRAANGFHSRASPSPRDSSGRVRLGYVSGDLMGTHPLTHLMQSVFGMHDKAGFEIYLYALNPTDGSHERRRMEREVEHFRDLSALTAREAAAMISEDGICVLVNLNGYAGTAKSADLFALRPAPVAVSYMGFPGTMGSLEMMDYILADGVVIPAEKRRFYSEKVLEMPHCYFVNDYQQSERGVLEGDVPSRAEHGLPPGGDVYDAIARAGERGEPPRKSPASFYRPDGVHEDGGLGREGGAEGQGIGAEAGSSASGVVLCNFNRLHKIDPQTFGAWMEVLKNVPGAILWLLDGGATARANLRGNARRAGVAEERIVFAPLVGKSEHLRRIRLADLFVDTPLYNAHTVGCDALWAGVPVVTLQGTKMASRVGASLVKAAGVPELVTDSMAEYARLVEDLARDDGRRRGLRLKVEGARLTCPLFDTERWVRDAELLLRWASERHEAGLPPEHHPCC